MKINEHHMFTGWSPITTTPYDEKIPSNNFPQRRWTCFFCGGNRHGPVRCWWPSLEGGETWKTWGRTPKFTEKNGMSTTQVVRSFMKFPRFCSEFSFEAASRNLLQSYWSHGHWIMSCPIRNGVFFIVNVYQRVSSINHSKYSIKHPIKIPIVSHKEWWI